MNIAIHRITPPTKRQKLTTKKMTEKLKLTNTHFLINPKEGRKGGTWGKSRNRKDV